MEQLCGNLRQHAVFHNQSKFRSFIQIIELLPRGQHALVALHIPTGRTAVRDLMPLKMRVYVENVSGASTA
jgi:hypothetical protein